MTRSTEPRPVGPKCRFCGAGLSYTLVDLGMSPLCESFLTADQLDRAEAFYPLHAWICHECFLAQVQEYVGPDRIFDEYAYFSSYSDSWLAHARAYVDMITERLGLDGRSRVAEIGSNDGYLLQYFVARGIPAFGVEPAANVAAAAVARGVSTLVAMFGRDTARAIAAERGRVDLLLGNNVLAQVADLNGFVDGLRLLLAPTGVLTLEFPHLVRLVEENQFDTIYHEHFSYFSLVAVERILAAHELVVFDVEELPTHGGSLRVYARHAAADSRPVQKHVTDLRAREEAGGFTSLARYALFTEQVYETKRRLLEFLIDARRAGKSIAGYGAPGKGNTLLNFCGIRTDFLDYTVDRNPYKHGKFLPGTHVPIFPPERILETRPDYVLILPWNLKEEIMTQMAVVPTWGGQFVVPIPTVTVYP